MPLTTQTCDPPPAPVLLLPGVCDTRGRGPVFRPAGAVISLIIPAPPAPTHNAGGGSTPPKKMDEGNLARLAMKTPEDADWAGVLRLPVRGPEGVVVVGVFDKANAALRTEFYAQQANKTGPAGATIYSRQARTGAGAGFRLGMDFLPNASGWPRVLDAIRASGHADGQIFATCSMRHCS